MIIRRLFGFSGSTLTNGAVSNTAQRTDPVEIANYIDRLADLTAPILNLVGSDYIELEVGEVYSELGALASDARDGELSVTVSGGVDSEKLGTYELQYLARDSAGNRTTIVRTVVVLAATDMLAPVISLNGDLEVGVLLGTAYVELGASAVDEVDGAVQVVISGQVDASVEGSYRITYSAQDSAGNVATLTRTVFVDPNVWIAGAYGEALDYEASCQNPRAGNGFSDVQGTVVDENFWIRAYSFDTYLWFDEIEDVDPESHSSTDAYFDVMKTFALSPSGNPKDKFHFTYDTEEWEKLSQSGISAGYGVNFFRVRSSPPRQWLVAYTEPNTPAGDAGLLRGWEIASVDGVDFKGGSDTDVLNAALFPESLGEVHEFVFRDVASGETTSVDLTSQEITSTPVQSVKAIPLGNSKVGYLLFNDHIATAEAQLIDAFEGFKSEGITELVLDMRYNGGGYLDIARMLASMIAGEEAVGQTFSELQFNAKYPTQDPITGRTLTPSRFARTAPGFVISSATELPMLNLDRVVVISGSGTCSASEAVINGLRGVGVEVILIGDTTCGKPYGFYGIDNCGTTYFTIQFKGVNASGFGDYTDGFSPQGSHNVGVEIAGCAVDDDLSHALGDPNEGRLSAALEYLSNGSCDASFADQKTRGLHPFRQIRGELVKPAPLSGAILVAP